MTEAEDERAETETSGAAPTGPPTGGGAGGGGGRGAGALDRFLDSSPDGALGGLRAADAARRRGGGARADRWAHRRGEPRSFALLWAFYLLVGAAMTIFSVRELGFLQAGTFRGAVRAMLLVIVVGVCALWPLVRLSQARPVRPALAAAADLVVVLIPAQGILWPLRWLAAWSWKSAWAWEVTAGLALSVFSWGVVTGALVALGTGTRSAASRGAFMLACLLVMGFAPGVMLVMEWSGGAAHGLWRFASPVTSIMALSSGESGASVRMTQEEWLGASAPFAAGALLWGIVRLRYRRR